MPPMRFYWWVRIGLEFDFKVKWFCAIMEINRWQKRWYSWKRPQANWWIFCAASQMQQPLFRRTLTSCRLGAYLWLPAFRRYLYTDTGQADTACVWLSAYGRGNAGASQSRRPCCAVPAKRAWCGHYRVSVPAMRHHCVQYQIGGTEPAAVRVI